MNSEDARQALTDEVTERFTAAIAEAARKRLAKAELRKQLAEARQVGIAARHSQKSKRVTPWRRR